VYSRYNVVVLDDGSIAADDIPSDGSDLSSDDGESDSVDDDEEKSLDQELTRQVLFISSPVTYLRS